MAKPWPEVANSEAYKALPPDKQEVARNQYFDTMVAPKAPPDKIDSVRAQFDSATKPQIQPAAPQNSAPVVADPAIASPVAAQPQKKLTLPTRKDSKVRETVRSLLRGATIGTSDVLGAGAAASMAALGGADFGEAYRDIKSDIGQSRDLFREENPVLAYGSEIAGGLVPAIATGGAAIAAPASAAGKVALGSGLGAAQGATYGASQAEAGQEAEGAVTGGIAGGVVGGALPAVAGAVRRVISPKASTNAELAAMKEMGVQPTIGQALGGIANKIEQKAQSIPIVGEKIASQRSAAREQFNTGVINEVLKPLGASIKGSGQEAIKEAGDIIGKKYDDALSNIDGVKFDRGFDYQLAELRGMAQNMTEESSKRFEKLIENNIGRRMSEAGAMLPETYKKVDSELGKIAVNASDKELGSAVKQLQALMRDQMMRSNPNVAGELKAADTAYAMLTRVEDAAGRAVNNDGIFSPAQLNAAIKSADKSTRKRATARGDALMQDIGSAGQRVLGETVPNSGTIDRGAQIATGALGVMNPLAVAGGLGAGYGMYTRPVQNALVSLVSRRPDLAPEIAQQLGVATNYLVSPASTGAARIANE